MLQFFEKLSTESKKMAHLQNFILNVGHPALVGPKKPYEAITHYHNVKILYVKDEIHTKLRELLGASLNLRRHLKDTQDFQFISR
jgi:hypothetical protein